MVHGESNFLEFNFVYLIWIISLDRLLRADVFKWNQGTCPFGFGARFKLALFLSPFFLPFFLFGSIKSHLLKIQIYYVDAVGMVTWFTGQTKRSRTEHRICLSVSINKPQNLYMLLIFIVIVPVSTPSRVYTQKWNLSYAVSKGNIGPFLLGRLLKRFMQFIDHH